MGHLYEFLTDKGKSTMTNKDRQITPPPKGPPADGMYGVISGGSEVSRVSYSSAKRHARAAANPQFQHSSQYTKATNLTIKFMHNEAMTLLNLHHDALMITLQIANIIVKRILIDFGYSTNVMFLEAFKVMGLDESSINRRPTITVGFNSKQKYTIGDIALPVYTERFNHQTTFMILDAPSPYNVILDWLWIHSMQAMPSTFY
ncbi:uncharacterized protein LOC116137262 [Pistacia vera]|uniref:uncharacterized protein LOC116137262 n=1 Tax=Pistacia vera TaxID=55513 RepID=UPI001263B8BC|nr:uncharacterized protein LOC116137262 [Pistacia vera]